MNDQPGTATADAKQLLLPQLETCRESVIHEYVTGKREVAL